jgi:hypothetical protein
MQQLSGAAVLLLSEVTMCAALIPSVLALLLVLLSVLCAACHRHAVLLSTLPPVKLHSEGYRSTRTVSVTACCHNACIASHYGATVIEVIEARKPLQYCVAA